jgi:Secretion system C-terminal sorting domain
MVKIQLYILIFFSGLVFSNQPLKGQSIMTGSLTGHMNAIIDSLPGSNGTEYNDPSINEYTTWMQLIDTLLKGHYSSATTLANSFNYDLINFIDNQQSYYILEKQKQGKNYWGTYVFNPRYCRNITIQSPHPKKDFNTGKQGIYLLRNTNARFYMLSGTNRCNATFISTCSGKTTICDGSSKPYPISDLAHNDSSIFQATTHAIMQFDPETYFIQLHGFTKKPTDPYAIMSNGTQITPIPDPIDMLSKELKKADDTLDFKIAHLDTAWTRLRGFFNVQGRLINHSVNPCNTNADTTLGKFIHLEQERKRLRQDSTKWNNMVMAVNNTFICITGLETFSKQGTLRIYPNPAKEFVFLDFNKAGDEDITLIIYDIQGRLIKTKGHIRPGRIDIMMAGLTPGLYFVQLWNGRGIKESAKFVIEP